LKDGTRKKEKKRKGVEQKKERPGFNEKSE